MKRERKRLTEKGLLKLIGKIKNGEDLDSQHRIFRGYNITITRSDFIHHLVIVLLVNMKG
jgi:hypothetical protein